MALNKQVLVLAAMLLAIMVVTSDLLVKAEDANGENTGPYSVT
jgi:hypothetical protein